MIQISMIRLLLNRWAWGILQQLLNIHQRFVDATGVLTAKEARLIQEGAFGIDLTGNMIVDMTVSVGSAANHLTTDIFTFSKLFDNSGKPNPSDAIEVDRQTIVFVGPRACQPVKAKAMVKATVRWTQGGDKTLIEGDDKALYELVKTPPQDFELVPAEALRFSVWFLVDARERPFHIERVTGNLKTEVLQFGNFDEANDFLRYMHVLPGDGPRSVKGRALFLNDRPLLKKDLQGLQAEQQRLNWEKSGCSPGPS
jgi:hypothetical protein